MKLFLATPNSTLTWTNQPQTTENTSSALHCKTYSWEPKRFSNNKWAKVLRQLGHQSPLVHQWILHEIVPTTATTPVVQTNMGNDRFCVCPEQVPPTQHRCWENVTIQIRPWSATHWTSQGKKVSHSHIGILCPCCRLLPETQFHIIHCHQNPEYTRALLRHNHSNRLYNAMAGWSHSKTRHWEDVRSSNRQIFWTSPSAHDWTTADRTERATNQKSGGTTS